MALIKECAPTHSVPASQAPGRADLKERPWGVGSPSALSHLFSLLNEGPKFELSLKVTNTIYPSTDTETEAPAESSPKASQP